ncbi:MAG TPA: hypothetical protein DCQ06_03090 [Myxococcales bacterium]|mgnify:CR=1 FL=1|nr:hypothetical protein [Myxococcales bacterium]HAN30560.1 hypothetical protein [Myxococcales bacterium]
MSKSMPSLLLLKRPIVLLFGVVLGACAGSAVTTVATEIGRPTVPPNAAPSAPTIVSLSKAVTWQVGGGKASVRALAHGQQAWIGKLSMAANGKVPLHRDPTEEYIHVLAGTGAITIDGVTTQIGPGDTVYMPANAEVTYTNGAQTLEAIQVFAGPAPAAKYTKWTRIQP